MTIIRCGHCDSNMKLGSLLAHDIFAMRVCLTNTAGTLFRTK